MPSLSSFPCTSPTDPRYTFVGSDYGPRPSNSGSGTDFHPGLDFNASARHDDLSFTRYAMLGLPVFAVGDGVVVYTAAENPARGSRNDTDGYGNLVVVEHAQWSDSPTSGPWYSLYAHLADMRVTTGRRVRCGEQIARVGATSNGRFTMGAHLHFEIRCRFHAPSAFNSTVPIPGTNDPAFLDWAAPSTVRARPGRPAPTFMERAGHGTTVDPIWWFEQRGVRILRAPEGSQRRGAILGGSGPLGTAVPNLGLVQNYAPAPLPATASYGQQSARLQAGLAGLGAAGGADLVSDRGIIQGFSATHTKRAMLGLGLADNITTIDASGRQTVMVLDASSLPYQPPVPDRTEMPLIPVTDPDTQAPPSTAAAMLVAGFGAVTGLALVAEALGLMRRR